VRFSYDAIRYETTRCVEPLQQDLRHDPLVARFVIENPDVRAPLMTARFAYAEHSRCSRGH
jgi:hypothetical protein